MPSSPGRVFYLVPSSQRLKTSTVAPPAHQRGEGRAVVHEEERACHRRHDAEHLGA
eukprot:COSAG06_NODE_62127_length_266_cov_0.455090_1_plen_55_part_01